MLQHIVQYQCVVQVWPMLGRLEIFQREREGAKRTTMLTFMNLYRTDIPSYASVAWLLYLASIGVIYAI